MSLQHKRDLTGYYGDWPGATAAQLIPPRGSPVRGRAQVTNDTAMRHSAVWASLRLRANLVSTMPVDSFRRVGGVQVETPKLPILVNPGGERVDVQEWLYSGQIELDRAGNNFGLITERNGYGLPNRIDLLPSSAVAVHIKGGEVDHYQVGNEKYDPAEVWHEKQYTLAGLHVGLSPVAYAAWSIGEYLSIQDFALDWFGTGGIPKAMLRNTQKTIDQPSAEAFKARFKQAVSGGDLFVVGADWEYQMIQAEQQGSAWLEAKQYGLNDIARFFDCPSDLIDAAVQAGSSITYANIISRNLQLLIMNLNPALRRREAALSRLLPQPRYVKFNRGALLEMDPATRAQVLQVQLASRQIAPSEARELENRPPFTEAQLAEIDRLYGAPRAQPAGASPQLQEV